MPRLMAFTFTAWCLFAAFPLSFPKLAPAGEPVPKPPKASATQTAAAIETLQTLGAKFKRDEQARITEISLASKQFAPDDLQRLAAFPHLQSLNLYETPLTDEGLANLRPLVSLKHLNLGSCRRITDDGVKHLAPLNNLESLNLGFCRRITDKGFAVLEKFRKLKTLNLSITNVRDDRLKTIAAMDELQHLDLDNTPITDEGLRHLADMRKLRSLRFVGAAVTDNGIAALHGIKTLRFLNVTDTHVTPAGIATLKQTLPSCVVKP